MHLIYWQNKGVIFTQRGCLLPPSSSNTQFIVCEARSMFITGICIRPTENQHRFTMFPLQEIKWCL